MNTLIFIFYTLAVRAGDVYIYIGSFFSEKLNTLRFGRKNTWKLLDSFNSNLIKHKHPSENGQLSNYTPKKIWIHCASLGEFEQGRPVIEKIKLNHPDSIIVLSFFSPSGYEIQKNYDKADVIFYLPSDTPENCDRLLYMIQPDVVIFVKYEFWWNLIRTLVQRNIDIFLISAVFRENDYFFRPIFRPFLSLLYRYRTIFVQDRSSADILDRYHLKNFMIAGDTRIDRVIQRSKASDVPSAVQEYTDSKKVMVYGSVWESDMPLVVDCIARFGEYVHVVAPHDITADNIKKLKKLVPTVASLYSDEHWRGNVLFINNIGMLGSLYSLAKYVYVGGGFQKGIHNILEPAVFNIPVFFGPNHNKFNEAIVLQNEHVAFSVVNSSMMIGIVEKFEQSLTEYAALSKKANEFFVCSQGATEKTVSLISSYL